MEILLVDDDKVEIEALDAYLYGRFNLTSFDSSLKALDHYRSNYQFDVVLVDYKMPNMNGDELIKKMLEINPNQKFIVISGFLTNENYSAFSDFDAKIIMIDKPIEVEELDRVLELILL